MEKIVVLGSGGHAKSVIDTIQAEGKYKIAGIISKDEHNIHEYPVLGSDEILEKIYSAGIHKAAMGIGFMGNGELRERLYFKLKQIGFDFPTIIDPSACLAKHLEIGEGTFIGKKAVVNTESRIGVLSIINTAAIVEHECEIGDYTHVAVSANLCGNVCVGNSCFIGANATVIQGLTIANHVTVGAGSVVVRDINLQGIYIGAPARRTTNE